MCCYAILELVPLRGEKSSSHALKTGSWYLLEVLYCTPKLWNGLPKSLKESETVTIFEKKLKTFLFRDYFNL